MPYFMGIDIGTFESKGVIMDGEANVVAYRACPHVMETPRPGWAEHDAEGVWWHDLCELSNGLIKESGLDPKEIVSLGVSGIGPCCLPVDKDLNPLRKAILYGIDTRAAKEIEFLNKEIGEDVILERYGTPLTTQSAGAKVLWIKNNEPEIYEKTAKFVTSSTYLVAKLTGKFPIDRYTAATWVPLYSIEKNDWEDDLRDICRLDQLADCLWTDEIAGEVHEQASRETGLAVGTKVTCGTADASAEGLSVGVYQPGDLMVMYGSSIFMIHVTDKLVKDGRVWAGPYLLKDTYAIAAGMACSGTLTRWFRDNFAKDIVEKAEAEGKNPYAELAKLAEGIPAGSDGLVVLPYFSGERTPINDPDAKGMIYGLNLLHNRGHVYKAILEGVGYGINQHFEIYRELGVETKKVMAVGGGVKNQAWLQAISDICGEKQQYAEVEIGAAYGDAMLAALGVGHYKSLDELSAVVKIKGCAEPDAANHAIYEPLARQYRALYESTKHIMHGEVK